MEPIKNCCFNLADVQKQLPDKNSPPPRRLPQHPQSKLCRQKSHSFAASTHMIRDIVEEQLDPKQEKPFFPPSLRKTSSDPSKELLAYTSSQTNTSSSSPIPSYQARHIIKQLFLPKPPLHRFYLKEEAIQFEEKTNVFPKSVMTRFFQEHANNPLIQQLRRKTALDLFNLRRENLTYPQIASPLKQALEMHAEKYKNKYGFSIHICLLSHFASLFEQIRSSIQHPAYVSFILADIEEDLDDGHVLPLLCSLGENKVEFLIMDVLGKEGDLTKTVHAFLSTFLPNTSIFIAEGKRQADTYSCRTGALALLRNAHLYLQLHHITAGFERIIRNPSLCPLDPTDVFLPSQWTYVEQLFHGEDGSPIIRDFFSKKIIKKNNPRTIHTFRQQHTEPVRFRFTLSNRQDYRADFAHLTPPEHVQATIQEHKCEFVFEQTMAINTYLLHKGLQRASV